MTINYKPLVGLGIIIFLIAALILRSKKPRIPIWSIMTLAAFITIVTDLISVDEIGELIELDVILFLIGMFSLVALADQSGLLTAIAYYFLSKFKSRYGAMFGSAFMFGFIAAFATNDAVALMGPPIAYIIAKFIGVDAKIMFLLLAFSLTIGSTATPIGNPQNILVAVRSGMMAPFIFFLRNLLVPTIINLVISTFLIIRFYRIENKQIYIVLIPHEAIKNRRDAILAGVGLLITIAALLINDIFELFGLPHVKHRGFIPFVVASIIYALSTEPRKIISGIDWGTIVFFIAMFIAMEGIWRSAVLQPVIGIIHPQKMPLLQEVVAISLIAILLSQVLSNVPLANLYLGYMKSIGYVGQDINAWLTLACASTIAGNLTLLGAASNIIILEVLESRYSKTITFTEFMKIGALITVVNMLIYVPFLIL